MPRWASWPKRIDRGEVELLVILGGNPVYNAPADLKLLERMQKVPLRFHLGLYQDETARQCHWHLPETHFLEAWSDARAYDGTESIVQPLIEPLYEGHSAHRVDRCARGPRSDARLRDCPRPLAAAGDTRAIPRLRGVLGKRAARRAAEEQRQPRRDVKLAGNWQRHLESGDSFVATRRQRSRRLCFEPDPTIYDGSYANNGWLQECPKPLTKLTWDNAATHEPRHGRGAGHFAWAAIRTAASTAATTMPVVELQLDGRSVRAPAWIMPGHADHTITVYLGYGREQAGRVGGTDGHTVGFNAYLLRTSEQPWFAPGLDIVKTDDSYLLAGTQAASFDGKPRPGAVGDAGALSRHPDFAAEPDREKREEQTHARFDGAGERFTSASTTSRRKHKWGMAIDLTACIGCNACVVACQAENNIPVVGKEQVARRPRNALASHRPLLDRARPNEPERILFPAAALHALRERAVRICLPGRSHGAQRRRA